MLGQFVQLAERTIGQVSPGGAFGPPAQLSYLALGPVTMVVALLFATLGCLLGIILATRARRCTGWRRVRLVAYATAALAGAGIWQPALIGVLGLRVDGSVVRLEPRALAQSLGVAVGATVLALLLVCYGRTERRQDRDSTRLPRLMGAGLLLAGAVGGSAYLMVQSLSTGGEFGYRRPLAAVAVGLAVACAAGLARALGSTRTLRGALGGAVLCGVCLAAVHAATAAALQVLPGPDGMVPANDVTGVSPMRLGAPAVAVGGFLIALLWYFSVGTATRRDLRLLFEAGGDADQIEPWMIEQVRARVALSSTAVPGVTGWTHDVWMQNTVAVRSVPLIAGRVASAFAGAGRAVNARPRPTTPEVGTGVAAGGPVGGEGAAAGDRPQWRPVPGWGVPEATRSVLDPSVAAPDQPAQAGAARRDWNRRDPAERNEQPPGIHGRAMNSAPPPPAASGAKRNVQLPRRAPSALPAVVPRSSGR